MAEVQLTSPIDGIEIPLPEDSLAILKWQGPEDTLFNIRVIDETDITLRLPGNNCTDFYLCRNNWPDLEIPLLVQVGHYYTWTVNCVGTEDFEQTTFSVISEESGGESGGGSDKAANLGTQIANLETNKADQIANVEKEEEFGLDWLFDIIERNIKALGIVLASYAAYIAIYMSHEVGIFIAKAIKTIGEAIEKLINALKNFNMAQATLDQGTKAATTVTDVISEPILKSQLSDIKDSVTQFLGDLWDQITQIGSYIETAGDIFGNVIDIIFDQAQIVFTLNSLAAQIKVHLDQIFKTEVRIEELIAAGAAGKEALLFLYDKTINSKNSQLESNEIIADNPVGAEQASGVLDSSIPDFGGGGEVFA